MNGLTRPDKTSIRTKTKRYYHLYHYGRTEYFKSKRDATARQFEINCAMSVNATAIGALCSEVYELYRVYYFRFGKRDVTRCQNAFTNFDKSLLLMVNRSHFVNGTTFTFKHYQDCCLYLQSVVEFITQHPDTQRNTFARHRSIELTERINYAAGAIVRLLGESEN